MDSDTMKCRALLQIAEARSDFNRYHCCNFHRRDITDPNELLAYFIKHGGAESFAKKFEEAMSDDNKWYCSEFYDKDIRDAETLWNYYLDHLPIEQGGRMMQTEQSFSDADLCTV
jgi:hypothetical protein